MKIPVTFLLAAAALAAPAAGVAQEPPAAETPAAAAAPTHAMAPPEEVATAPKVGPAPLTLPEAVRLTLLHDPRLQGEKQRVAGAMGQFREARGPFDLTLSAGPSLNYTQSELSNFFMEKERGKREILSRLAEEFRAASAAVRQQLLLNDVSSPSCPESISVVSSESGSEDLVDRTALRVEDTIVILPADLIRGQEEFFELCRARDEVGVDPATMLNFVRSVNQAAQLGLGDEVLTVTQIPRESLTLINDVADVVAIKAQLAFDRVGANPVDEVSENMTITAGWTKLFRSGVIVRSNFRAQGLERNFKGKSLDPAFGGFGLRNDFPASLLFTFDVPLGKERGSVSTAAPERAASFSLRAQRETLREAMSEEVFSTVLAYISLQAAQQSLALLEESAARQQKLVDVSSQLVEGGEQARSELDRVKGRAALVSSQLADARRSVIQARLGLAQAAGIAVESMEDAPLAGDPAPLDTVVVPPPNVLVEQALANRRQLRAATHLQDATRVLAGGARADLKRRVDFVLTAGLNTLYESPFLRVFPEEQDVQPYENGVRFSSPSGYWRSFGQKLEPQVSAQLTFDLPFKNNTARGRLLQEESSFRTSQIQRADIERTIRDNVIDVAENVRRAAEAVALHREAVGYYEKTLESAMDRYQAGDVTLLDTLVTEEDLTRQRQQLVRAVQTYTSLLARLKFETGEILRFDDEGSAAESAAFDPAGFVAR